MVRYNGFYYRVSDEHPKETAEILDKMNNTAIKLIELMRKRLEKHDSGERRMTPSDYVQLSKLYNNLRKRYNPDVIQETIYNPLQPELTSYTVQKGKVLSMCVRYNGEREPWPVLLLVLLHELTHIASNVRQHPPAFWDNYKFILRLVVEEGWGKDLKLPPGDVLYCGRVQISSDELARLKHLYPDGDPNSDILSVTCNHS